MFALAWPTAAASVVTNVRESWRWALPGYTARDVAQHQAGNVAAMFVSSTTTVVTVLAPDSTVVAARELSNFVARTFAANASGATVLSDGGGRYAFWVETLVLTPDLQSTNWHKYTHPDFAYYAGLWRTQVDGAGRVFHGGMMVTHRSGAGDHFYVLSEDGATRWFAKGQPGYNFHDGKNLVDLQIAPSGDVIVAENYYWASGRRSCTVFRYSPDGARRHAVLLSDVSWRSFSIDAADRVTGTGIVEEGWPATYHVLTSALDRSGEVLWQRTIRTNISTAVAAHSTHSFVVTPSDLFVYAADGRELSHVSSGGTLASADERGGVYVVQTDDPATPAGVAVKRFDATGQLQWVTHVSGPAGARFQPVRLLSQTGSVYLLGNWQANGQSTGFLARFEEFLAPARHKFFDEIASATNAQVWLPLSRGEPLVQELTTDLASVEFVDLSVSGAAGNIHVALHSAPDDALIGVSEVVMFAGGASSVLTFSFPEAVSVTPGALLRLRVHRLDGATASEPLFVRAQDGTSYARGRLIQAGLPEEALDLDFALGVFVQDWNLHNDAAGNENSEGFVAPTAIWSADERLPRGPVSVSVTVRNSIADDHLGVSLPSDGGWLSVHGREVARASGGAAGGALTITFLPNTETEDIQHVLRRITLTSTKDETLTEPRWLDLVVSNTAGITKFEIRFTVLPQNDPPQCTPRIHNNTVWGVLLFRGRTVPVVFDASATTDPDSTQFSFWWEAAGHTLEQREGVMVTNNFRAGSYTCLAGAWDGTAAGKTGFDLGVTKASVAIRSLMKMPREVFRARDRHLTIRPLQNCVAALEREDFRIAKAKLTEFKERVTALRDHPDYNVETMLVVATSLLEDAVWPE